MEIDGGVCVVRPWRSGDEPALVENANNRKVWLNLRDLFPHPYTPADADRWVRYAGEARPATHFAIVVDGRAAGGIGYDLGSDVARFTAEIGYWLREPVLGPRTPPPPGPAAPPPAIPP